MNPLPSRMVPIRFLSTALLTGLLLVACTPAENGTKGAQASDAVTGSAAAPINRARSRPTALRFGMYVTPDPQHNPIDPPERFIGYHVGLDFELFGDETDQAVPVFAICNGSVLYSGFAKGYGGLLVQRCEIGGERVTILYGHLDTTDSPPEDTVLSTGQQIGILAPPYSKESDGNRKHLHLGIRRGEVSDFRGYVQDPKEMALFVDPASVLAPGASGRPVAKYTVVQKPYSRP